MSSRKNRSGKHGTPPANSISANATDDIADLSRKIDEVIHLSEET